MTGERYVRAIVYLVAFTWTVILYAIYGAISSTWLQPVSIVVTIVVYAVVAFDLWLWRLPFLQGWFVKRPVIDGSWKVELRSNWRDPNTETGILPIEGYMVVRQTFSTLSMRLMTEESISELVGTEIVCSVDSQYCVSGVYRNEPRLHVRESSTIHYGAVWLRIIDEPVMKLIGHYWTDRQTAGEMELTHRQKGQTFQTFQSAQAHYRNLLRNS